MTINEIIKRAIERLKREGKMLTPDFYAEAFCAEAKKAGILVEDCNQVDKYLNTLESHYQNEIKQYRIRTTQELIRFLISKLNRMQPSQCAELLHAQSTLSKRILQAVEVLHNAEATDLAKKTILAIDEQTSTEQLEHYRQAWINFLTLYDSSFLQRFAPYGSVDSGDLKKTVEQLTLGKAEQSGGDLNIASSLLVASLVPSIASSVNDQIATLSGELRSHPQMLTSQSVVEEVKQAIKLRIALDKQNLKEMVESLDTVLDKLSTQLIELIERSDHSNVEIQQIKHELEGLERLKESDFAKAHSKLYTIVVTLEQKTEELSHDLREHNSTVGMLNKRVHELEAQLEAAQKASTEDFLTKLYNKRALEQNLKIKEGEFDRYGRNFSIVMFDLDHFKKINDTYGHEAGDAVLSAFGKILKDLGRTVDIIGRYGGEEFMGLLSDTDLKGAVTFARKVNEQVLKTRFMYKDTRMEVSVSCGVAQRKDFPSLKATVNSADQHLYDAKKKGRNRVEPNL